MPTDATLPQLRVLPDPEAAAVPAATAIADGIRSAIEERGVAHWATTGGSAAAPMYRALGSPPLRERVEDLDIGGPLLAPGVGAQGGGADDVRRIFAGVLDRVLPSSSRAILSALRVMAPWRRAVTA